MPPIDQERILNLLLVIPSFVAALTVHEFAHAWMGNRLGDDTARRLGRLTLDPIKHLDPFGSLAFLFGALYGIFFGWAKPVPFNPRNLSQPRRDSMLIAVAGPISNLLQIPFWFLALWIAGRVLNVGTNDIADNSTADMVLRMLQYGIIVNLSLAAFNMIPIPPLDGHYVLEGLGPPAIGQFFDMIRPYSFMLLLLLLNLPAAINPISQAMYPIREIGYRLAGLALGYGWVR